MVEAAYASCIEDARRHYENFPVASRLLPRDMRRHVAAVYAFARAADDFADEGAREAADRERLLDGWRRRLHAAAETAGPGAGPAPGEPANTMEIFLAVGATIREKDLPVSLFDDLLSAFRQDVRTTRYDTWDELLDYCRRSANPVGRLVLRIADHRDAQLDDWSDAVCTALQLTNFWQDAAIDASRGRIYLPASERRAHGADEAAIAAGRMTDGWRRALRAAAARTHALFSDGRPICDAVDARIRWQLRATWLGGTRILARLAQVDFDVFERRPTLGIADAAWFAWHFASWRRSGAERRTPIHESAPALGTPDRLNGPRR